MTLATALDGRFSRLAFQRREQKNNRAMAAHLILSIMFAVNESEWPFRDIRELIHRFKCHSAYLDIGSNVGVQVRKLYEPQLYAGKDPMLERLARKWDVYNEPTAEERAAGIVKGAEFWNITSPVLPIFDKHFGKAPRCGVCAIAVEPNPRHTARHKELQAVLQAAGAGALWLSRTAASTSNGQLDITTQDDPDNGVGFSVRQGRRLTSWLGSLFNRPKSTSTGSVSIRSIDLAVQNRKVRHRGPAGWRAPDISSAPAFNAVPYPRHEGLSHLAHRRTLFTLGKRRCGQASCSGTFDKRRCGQTSFRGYAKSVCHVLAAVARYAA